jgi:hypothetical protein
MSTGPFTCGRVRTLAAAMLALVLPALTADARQAPPDHGFTWKTIGDPGNRPASAKEAPYFYFPPSAPPLLAGSVSQPYRLMDRPVSNRQYMEFLNSYWPHANFALSPDPFEVTGRFIYATNFNPGEDPGYRIIPGYEDVAISVSWRTAAVLCNWLENNKGTTAAAFASGAYNISTFTTNKNGTVNDQIAHTPGARYWIPTLDEWTKGMYYDPNRYGSGQPGYWLYPHRSDSPPVYGLPGTPGAQSAAGVGETFPMVPVGAFPDVQSPWGLLDGSGTDPQWLETATFDSASSTPTIFARLAKGTGQMNFTNPILRDRVERFYLGAPQDWGFAIRLASTVPAPSVALVFGVAWAWTSRRARRV